MNNSYAVQLGVRSRGRTRKRVTLALTMALGIVGVIRFASPVQSSAATMDSLERLAPATSSISLSSNYHSPRMVGQSDAPWLTESSGITRSALTARLWTHNDSGDEAKIYCLTERANSCGTWQVSGAQAIDWEAISVGPGPKAGVSYLFAADIGDNELARDHVTVYRFPEPDQKGSGVTGAAVPMDLGYPDGPHNAEGMFVHPITGQIYIVTKEASGRAGVYRSSGRDVDGVKRLTKVAVLKTQGLSSVTAADISPDGTRVVLGTYGSAFEFLVPSSPKNFDSVWKEEPAAIDVGRRIQGEALTYSADGRSLFSTSEMSPMPLYRIRQTN